MPSMTRKDYELIAGVLKELKREWSTDPYMQGAFAQWQRTVHEFTSALATTNPAFDPMRFARACGATEGD